jgi:hypothetical protein
MMRDAPDACCRNAEMQQASLEALERRRASRGRSRPWRIGRTICSAGFSLDPKTAFCPQVGGEA